jgi:hypothetical protein
MSASSTRKQNNSLGDLQVKAQRRPPLAPPSTLEQLKADALLHMRRSGITPDESRAHELTQDIDPRSIAVDGWLGGYTLTRQFADSKAALRIGFMKRDDA